MASHEAPLPEEIRKEILLTEILEKSWVLLAQLLEEVRDNSLTGEVQPTQFIRKLTARSWEHKLELRAREWMRQEPRLKNVTEARVVVMTANAFYYRVLKSLYEEETLSAEYISVMEAVRLASPWNSGRPGELTVDQLEKALEFVNSKLTR